MIRKFSKKIMLLAAFALCLTATPILVHADIYLKPNASQDNDKEEKSSKSFFWNPFKKKSNTKENNAFYKSKSIKVVKQYAPFEAKPVDPKLMAMSGPEPQTAEELMKVAAAHKAQNLNAVQQMKEINAVFVQHKMAEYEKKKQIVAANHKKKQQQAAAYKAASSQSKASSQKQGTQKKVYVAPSSLGLKKPKKVFTNYR